MLLVVPVKDTDEALRFIRERDHPLVVYVFSQDKAFKNKGRPGLPMWRHLWMVDTLTFSSVEQHEERLFCCE